MAICPACNAEVDEGKDFCPACLAEIPTDDIVGDDEIAEHLTESAITGKPTGFYGIVQCPDHPDEVPLGQCPECQRYICEICMPDIRRRRPEEMVCEVCQKRAEVRRAPEEIRAVSRELGTLFIGYGCLVLAGLTLAASWPFDVPLGRSAGLVFGVPLVVVGIGQLAFPRSLVAWLGVGLELFVTILLGVMIVESLGDESGFPLFSWLLSALLLATLVPPVFGAVRALRLAALRADLKAAAQEAA